MKTVESKVILKVSCFIKRKKIHSMKLSHKLTEKEPFGEVNDESALGLLVLKLYIPGRMFKKLLYIFSCISLWLWICW